GWFLHAVASTRASYDLYPASRRRQAFQVSAHIFDLALASTDLPRHERLRFSFAAQIGYIRGEINPNAVALYRQRLQPAPTLELIQDGATVALELGTAILANEAAWLRTQIGHLLAQAAGTTEEWGVSIDQTAFGATVLVVRGVDSLLEYLVRGNPALLSRSREF